MFEIILVILTPDSNSWIDIVNSSDHFYLFYSLNEFQRSLQITVKWNQKGSKIT